MSRTTRVMVLATAVAGTGAGMVAAAGSASASLTLPVVNTVSAGYVAGNIFGPRNLRVDNTWRFRYTSATVRLPSPVAPLNVRGDTMSAVNKYSGFAVHLANRKQTIVMGISWNQNTTTPRWNVNVAQEYRAGGIGYNCNSATTSDSVRGTDCSTGARFINGNQFRPGTLVRLDLYYNQSTGSIHWNAYANGRQVAFDAFAAWTPQSSGGGAFTEAFAGADFSTSAYSSAIANFTRPTASARLFPVTAVHFTSYNGTKGTVVGPWVYSQLQVGTSPRNIYASAPALSNGGSSFRVLLLH